MTKYADAPKPVQEYYHKRDLIEPIFHTRKLFLEEYAMAGLKHLRDENGLLNFHYLKEKSVREKVMQAKREVVLEESKRQGFDYSQFKMESGEPGEEQAAKYMERILLGSSYRHSEPTLEQKLISLSDAPQEKHSVDTYKNLILGYVSTPDGNRMPRVLYELSEHAKEAVAAHLKEDHKDMVYDYLNKDSVLDGLINKGLMNIKDFRILLDAKYIADKSNAPFTKEFIRESYRGQTPHYLIPEKIEKRTVPADMTAKELAEYTEIENDLRRKIISGEITPEELLDAKGKTKTVLNNLMSDGNLRPLIEPKYKEAMRERSGEPRNVEEQRQREAAILRQLDDLYNQGKVNEGNIMQIAEQNQIPQDIVSKFLAYKLKQAKSQPPQPTPPLPPSPPQPEPPEPQPRREHEPRPPEPTPGPEHPPAPTPQPEPQQETH